MSATTIFGPWTGAVSDSSAVVKAAVSPNSQVRLVYGKSADLQNRTTVSPDLSIPDDMLVISFPLDGLDAATRYHYAVEFSDGERTPVGTFATFPTEDTATSFRFVCAGDADTESNHEVFDTILEERPLFFCHLGDMHYSNIQSTKTKWFREAYERVFKGSRQANLYRNIPITYVWDDHDFAGGDNSTSHAPGRLAARTAYQECFPHYPLIEGSGNVAIYQAFTVGRVRFLLTDTRSEKSRLNAPDDATKTVLGTDQKEWLKNELKQGKDRYPLVVWVNGIPWIGKKKTGSDKGFGYSTERREIADFIEAQGIRNVLMLSADAHMVAIDDGSNNAFSSSGNPSFPVFHAAALDRAGTVKGEPYSHGYRRGKGQYGVVTIEDSGGATVKVKLEGKNQDKQILRSEEGNILLAHEFTSPY